MAKSNVVLCAPVRTAIGTYGGSLKGVAASDLGAAVIKATLERTKLKGSDVDSAVMGQVVQAGAKMNPARQAMRAAGLPVEVPAMTVNRVCGSGAQAIASAAQEVMLGHASCCVAGGMENMDQAPYVMSGGRWGYRMGDAQIYDSMLRDGLNDAFSGQHSGWHTEDLVTKYQVTREAQDAWALRTQQRFAKAQAAGRFAGEIVPVVVPGGKKPTVFDKDEHNRPDATAESLAKLKPAFRKDGMITAGGAPGLNKRRGRNDRCRRQVAEKRPGTSSRGSCHMVWSAVDPGMFGLRPIPAVRQALERAAGDRATSTPR
jgi:acetyl-CoA C-acetyltransferase